MPISLRYIGLCLHDIYFLRSYNNAWYIEGLNHCLLYVKPNLSPDLQALMIKAVWFGEKNYKV